MVLPSGGRATGYGSEAQGDFADYIEKAETKAIGRALAALGYGTQFALDFDLGGEQVDAGRSDLTATADSRAGSRSRADASTGCTPG